MKETVIKSLYPDNNENATDKSSLGALDHGSALYANYIDQRLRELCALPPDQKYQRPNEDLSFLDTAPKSIAAVFGRKKLVSIII
ncbi:hypothetical protein [Xenorhabdus innexi]|uniref:hypothetical protein n=1 Tax=Xenorhabdus innexi TaxID=290109 RepID=UPI00117E0521|nr:hypothetical protein [Xenorhabdus innexi]